MFLTALALFTLGQAVQPPADLREQLERAAEKLKYFPTSDFLYDRIEERFIPKDWQLTWLNAYRAITTAKASHEDTVALLQHKDPAVRTLALAILFYQENPKNLTAIASMRGDKERTVPHVAVRAARLAGSEKKLYPQEVEPQTVGDVAEAMLKFVLAPAGYYVKDLEKYLESREHRTYWASWYNTRFLRAYQGSSAFPPPRHDRMKLLRRDIDQLPQPDRDWILRRGSGKSRAMRSSIMSWTGCTPRRTTFTVPAAPRWTSSS